MKRQDEKILKAMLNGTVRSLNPARCKRLANTAVSLPLIYMGDRDVSDDEVLNFMPDKEEPVSLIGQSTYDEYIFMLKLPNYTEIGVEHMPPAAREQFRKGDVDVWVYVNHNPLANFYSDDDGEVGITLENGDPEEPHEPSHIRLRKFINDAPTNESLVYPPWDTDLPSTKVDLNALKRTEEAYEDNWGGLDNLRFSMLTVICMNNKTAIEWSGTCTENVMKADRFTVESIPQIKPYYDTLKYEGETFLRDNRDRLDQGNWLQEEMRLTAVTVVRSISCLNNYLKYGDKHMVEVVPTIPKKKRNTELTKNRPWLNATGPHVLLLDRMPTTQKEHQGGTHASPKPHRRRGHWKTLQHSKYRHHPQYQKKIYIKPTFVGPREVTYDGHIYRLVEPLEDILPN